MKKLIFFIITSLVVFCSCEKQKKEIKLTITGFETAHDKVILTWQPSEYLKERGGLYYAVLRRSAVDSPEVPVASITETSFVDTTVPASPYLLYRVEAANLDGTVVTSDIREYLRPELKPYNMYLMDALYDPAGNQLFLFSGNGKVARYDASVNTVVKEIQVANSIGYPAIDIHNGQVEIYVPTPSGVKILNSNLDIIAELLLGIETYAVVSHNGLLFVSAQDGSAYRVVVHRRDNMSEVGEAESFYKRVNLKMLPGTNTELVGLGILESRTRTYFKFDADGTYVSQLTGTQIENEENMFEVLPNGSGYVTASTGSIFNKDQSPAGFLPRDNFKFTGYGYGNNRLYAGCSDKKIRVFDPGNFSLVQTFNTIGFPLRMFYDDGQIICVSSTEYPWQYPYTIGARTLIEKIQ